MNFDGRTRGPQRKCKVGRAEPEVTQDIDLPVACTHEHPRSQQRHPRDVHLLTGMQTGTLSTWAYRSVACQHHANAWVPNFKRLQTGQLPGGKALKKQNIRIQLILPWNARVPTIPLFQSTNYCYYTLV